MKKLYILLFLLINSITGFTQSKLTLRQQWSFDSYGEDIGKAGLFAKDIDKDGKIEIIASGAAGSADSFDSWGFFSVISYNPETQTYQPKWISHLFFNEMTELQLFDIDGDGSDEIFLGFDNGEINVVNTTNYTIDHAFFTRRGKPDFFNSFAVTSLSFGDIDNDGTKNIVATSGDSTYIFDTAFKLKRRLYLKGGKATLANVDLDPAIETIYSKGYIVQFSGAEQKTDMRFFPSIYGESNIRIADINMDGVKDVAFNSADSVHVLDVRSKQRFKTIVKAQSFGYVSDFQLHDYTGDGVPDFFVGNEQHDVLYVYNGLTTAFDYELHDPKRYGLDALILADVDDEPGSEIIWTSGGDCSCSDHLFIYDMESKDMKWMNRSHYVHAFDVADLDAAPGSELLVGSMGTYMEYFDQGFFKTFNLADKNIVRDFDEQFTNNHHIDGITSTEVGDIDDDGQEEILVGVDNGYAYTMLYVYDKDFNHLRTIEAWGMNFISDIEIADVDDDGKTEIIVTLGTNVAGSTHPHEYQNYIYIFDGKSGAIKWKSEQLAGIGSRIGNIRVGNIDNDPAKEIIALRYHTTSFSSNPQTPTLYIVDGWNFNVLQDQSFDYNALDLVDFDKDGTHDIIAGTESGLIVVLDGQSLAVKRELAAGKGRITSLLAVDINGDQTEDFVFTNMYKLHVLDAVHSRIIETDTLHFAVGLYGSLQVHRGVGSDIEILVDANHTLFSFRLESVPNAIPSTFDLLTPVNNAAIPSPEFVEFSWEKSDDDDPVTYTFSLSGNGMDTVITNIRQTHVVMRAELFEMDAIYTWSVTATDNFENTTSQSYKFKVTDEVILAIDETPIAEHLNIYPNPFHINFVIQNDSEHTINELIITDRNGRQHYTRQVTIPARGKLSIEEVQHLPPGVYLCSMRWNGSSKHTVKIAKY